jgi:DNA-binding GntR family transcriptional regulator
MRAAADTAAPEALSALKRRFYEVLMRGCGNAYVPRMLAPLLSRITQLRLLSMAAPGRLPAMLAEIDAIVAAVERRDAEAAARACRAHVRQAGRIALAALEASLRTGRTAPETET